VTAVPTPKDVELNEDDDILLKKIKLQDGEEVKESELELIDQIYLNAWVKYTLGSTPSG